MTSLWQDHQPPEGGLVTPEGLQEGTTLEGCSRAHVAIPAVQAFHSICLVSQQLECVNDCAGRCSDD